MGTLGVLAHCSPSFSKFLLHLGLWAWEDALGPLGLLRTIESSHMKTLQGWVYWSLPVWVAPGDDRFPPFLNKAATGRQSLLPWSDLSTIDLAPTAMICSQTIRLSLLFKILSLRTRWCDKRAIVETDLYVWKHGVLKCNQLYQEEGSFKSDLLRGQGCLCTEWCSLDKWLSWNFFIELFYLAYLKYSFIYKKNEFIFLSLRNLLLLHGIKIHLCSKTRWQKD